MLDAATLGASQTWQSFSVPESDDTWPGPRKYSKSAGKKRVTGTSPGT
jgi:hypothetical protein